MNPNRATVVASRVALSDCELPALIGNTKDKPRRSGAVVGVRATTVYRELRALGASRDLAARVAGNASRRWHNSRLELNRLMRIACFDRLGAPRLS